MINKKLEKLESQYAVLSKEIDQLQKELGKIDEKSWKKEVKLSQLHDEILDLESKNE